MLSVIIPTLNEAAQLPDTLTRVRAVLHPGDEIIVADGGSTDGTREVASDYGAEVVCSARGRGTQLNAGAAAATGDILLFLHADTHLPPDAADLIRRTLSDPAALGGSFTLRFDAPGLLPRLFAAVYNARSRRSRLFYGDSALFARRVVFDAVGGYGEAVLMEDYALCLALRAEAKRLRPDLPLSQTLPLLPAPVITSARRFHGKRGLAWRMVGVWTLLHLLYALGARPEALERWFYPPARESLSDLKTSGGCAMDDGQFLVSWLHDEVNMGHLDKVRVLLRYGADVNGRNVFEQTPLMAAAHTGQPEMVNLLLGFGADDSAVDWNGMTALQLAESVGHIAVVACLREHQKKPAQEPPT